MSFKDMVREDCKKVFLNNNEFAELHTIRYDGDVYDNIPVVITQFKEADRKVAASDNMEGIHLVSAIVHLAADDIGGVIPEQKRPIEIDDGIAVGMTFYKKYTIITSSCEMGMVHLELEAYDE